MCLEKRRRGPFIGYKREANPTSNRCGMGILTKSNKDDYVPQFIPPNFLEFDQCLHYFFPLLNWKDIYYILVRIRFLMLYKYELFSI